MGRAIFLWQRKDMPRISNLPKRLQPMLATSIDAPFDDPQWVFENKWDGFRIVSVIEDGGVTLYSRNGKVVSKSYLPVARALEKIGRDAVIDGELAALDKNGISRFQLLQNALRTTANLRYFIFDIMFLEGEDLRALPLVERKEHLRRIVPKGPLLAFSEHRPEHGTRYFKEAQRKGLEGIMAKRASSIYASGIRSRDWLKIKIGKRQEVVIVGFTAPRRSRSYFGSLVLAVRHGKGWRYVGRVGTGFSHAALADIHRRLWPLRIATSPFKERVRDEGVTTWAEPRLVAEVSFTEWTEAGEMRHPVFLGLREDKRPGEVVMEGVEPRSRYRGQSPKG